MASNDDPMSVAFAEAREAESRGETPIGAALARDGKVIASAGNRTRGDSDPTAHAEMVVLRQAAADARRAPADRLRSLRDARTLRDVRRRDQPRAAAPALLRRARPEGRRGRAWPALLLASDLPARAGGLRRHPRKRGGGDAAGVLRRETVAGSPAYAERLRMKVADRPQSFSSPHREERREAARLERRGEVRVDGASPPSSFDSPAFAGGSE